MKAIQEGYVGRLCRKAMQESMERLEEQLEKPMP